jgi:hypothetical protein
MRRSINLMVPVEPTPGAGGQHELSGGHRTTTSHGQPHHPRELAMRRAGSTDDLRAGVTLGQAFPALAGRAAAMARAVVIATAPMALRMVRQVRRIASPSMASRLIAHVVHPAGHEVLALMCGGTDQPGPDPSETKFDRRHERQGPELEQQPGGAQVVRRRAAGSQFSLRTAQNLWPDGDTAQEC